MAHKITRKMDLNSDDYYVEVEAPLVAERFKAGNFTVLMTVPHGERIPMSIMKAEDGKIAMFIKKLGKTSVELYKELDTFENVIGPMGKPIDVKNYGTVVVASDLVCGHAENYAICKALKEAGNKVISFQTFPTEKDIYPEEVWTKPVCDEFHLTTEDGSKGEEGHYIDLLEEMLENGEKVDIIFAGGSLPNLKELGEMTKEHNIPTIVTVRQIMVDASGMCGACRVFVDNEMQLACIDGPMFDAHKVDWDAALRRPSMYAAMEKVALEHCKELGRCE
jgi:ferredoxin--NADP+ reductase